MTKPDYQIFDADHHYYEAEDAFTRHIDPKMRRRCMQWADVDGKRKLMVGGKLCPFIPNPTFDPVAKPGCMDQFFRAKNPEGKSIKELFGELEPIRPEYRDRDARVALMDKQGIEAMFMFPTLGVGMEQALKDDPEAVCAAFYAFNRWLDEDWGCNYKDRIFAAPYISLVNPDFAVSELEWALEQDVRVVVMRSGPVMHPNGNRSLGHPDHDIFWKLASDSGITVAFHSGDSGYHQFNEFWGEGGHMKAFGTSLLGSALSANPISDTVASLILDGVFDRHRNLRVATIESGSSWVKTLLKSLRKTYGQFPQAFKRDPADTLREHVWVSPYYEDDLQELKTAIGAERIIFGSDYPHAEGLAEPVSFMDDIAEFSAAEQRLIMRDNGMSLIQRRRA
ncbi:amidohydrolase family protein [Litorivivens sp.]|uniref:amidohydrolase family protein n=1 Tax=Litorivivens sp. TaxID=2020868 RepID=UPI003567CBC9